MSLTEHQKEVMRKVLRSKDEKSFIYEKIIRQEKLKNKERIRIEKADKRIVEIQFVLFLHISY